MGIIMSEKVHAVIRFLELCQQGRYSHLKGDLGDYFSVRMAVTQAVQQRCDPFGYDNAFYSDDSDDATR